MENLKNYKQMGDHHGGGTSTAILSFLLGIFTLITIKDVQIGLGILGSVIGIAAGCYSMYVNYKKSKQ